MHHPLRYVILLEMKLPIQNLRSALTLEVLKKLSPETELTLASDRGSNSLNDKSVYSMTQWAYCRIHGFKHFRSGHLSGQANQRGDILPS